MAFTSIRRKGKGKTDLFSFVLIVKFDSVPVPRPDLIFASERNFYWMDLLRF